VLIPIGRRIADRTGALPSVLGSEHHRATSSGAWQASCKRVVEQDSTWLGGLRPNSGPRPPLLRPTFEAFPSDTR